jgi:hypothetical protein
MPSWIPGTDFLPAFATGNARKLDGPVCPEQQAVRGLPRHAQTLADLGKRKTFGAKLSNLLAALYVGM